VRAVAVRRVPRLTDCPGSPTALAHRLPSQLAGCRPGGGISGRPGRTAGREIPPRGGGLGASLGGPAAHQPYLADGHDQTRDQRPPVQPPRLQGERGDQPHRVAADPAPAVVGDGQQPEGEGDRYDDGRGYQVPPPHPHRGQCAHRQEQHPVHRRRRPEQQLVEAAEREHRRTAEQPAAQPGEPGVRHPPHRLDQRRRGPPSRRGAPPHIAVRAPPGLCRNGHAASRSVLRGTRPVLLHWTNLGRFMCRIALQTRRDTPIGRPWPSVRYVAGAGPGTP